jgi:hypothetical protein
MLEHEPSLSNESFPYCDGIHHDDKESSEQIVTQSNCNKYCKIVNDIFDERKEELLVKKSINEIMRDDSLFVIIRKLNDLSQQVLNIF